MKIDLWTVCLSLVQEPMPCTRLYSLGNIEDALVSCSVMHSTKLNILES